MAMSRAGRGHRVTFVHSIDAICTGKDLFYRGFKGCPRVAWGGGQGIFGTLWGRGQLPGR